MGRQIHFYMLREDQMEFLRMTQEHDSTTVALRDSDSSQIEPIVGDVGADQTLCLWNRKLLPNLERQWIPDPGYHRVDTLKMPILEFLPSFTATWEGKPALGQGRLFGNFEPDLGKPEAFEKWYERLVRWIQQRYRRIPASTGGYVGPAAYSFFEHGGYLLPNFLPPKTKEWISEIGKQHRHSNVLSPMRKKEKTRSR